MKNSHFCFLGVRLVEKKSEENRLEDVNKKKSRGRGGGMDK